MAGRPPDRILTGDVMKKWATGGRYINIFGVRFIKPKT